jgi:DNA helicase-2/ATP-dependent DNA helicase PcrA
VRFAISNAKNQKLSPDELEQEQPNYRGRVIADVYRHYQKALAENNALDFDDLILVPVHSFSKTSRFWVTGTNASATFWWMNTRTPTAPSMN